MHIITAIISAVGAVASCPSGHHCTNSHLHSDVRAYPLHREGHNRGTHKPLPEFEPDTESIMSKVMIIKEAQRDLCEKKEECPRHISRSGRKACTEGKVDQHDCFNIDLLGFVPIADMNSDREASDIWGWTDPVTKDQIAIIGMEDRTAFVKVTRSSEPIVLATLLQSGTNNVIWSDNKVYGNYVFNVRESNHGMQVYDLTKLRKYYNNTDSQCQALLQQEDLTYFYGVTMEAGSTGKVSRSSHNIVINEETGFAYLVGTKTCRGGLHVVDISDFGHGNVNGTADPTPRFVGCFKEDGYTHDAQCVIYNGPDTRFSGKELCWAYNEDTITLIDVSDKENMQMISRETYQDASYTHQGWLARNQRYVIANDELDEIETYEHRTRTLIWDYEDLTQPTLLGYRFSQDGIKSVDHNLYVKDDKIYLANYCSGFRVYELSEDFPTTDLLASIPQVAFFDTAPYCDTTSDSPVFQGAWSSFPYFQDDSDMVIVSNIETGLFILDVKV